MNIGAIAGILTTAAFVPQVIKTLRTKDTSGISLGMYCLQVLGISLWIVHAVNTGDSSLLIANTVTVCLSAIILICKLRYPAKRPVCREGGCAGGKKDSARTDGLDKCA